MDQVKRAFEEQQLTGKRLGEIVVVPGAEHDLILPDGTLAPQYERTLVEWLTTRLPAGPA